MTSALDGEHPKRGCSFVRPADAERWRRGDLPDDSYLV